MLFSQWEVWGISGWIIFVWVLFALLAVAALLYYFLMQRALIKYLKQFHDSSKDYPKKAQCITNVEDTSSDRR